MSYSGSVKSSATRSESWHCVPPNPSRQSNVRRHGVTSRITKSNLPKQWTSIGRHLGTKKTLHKCLTSIFGIHHEHNLPLESSRSSSDGSSLNPNLKVSAQSVPSFDLVSPDLFLFSGPSLHSGQSQSRVQPPSPDHERSVSNSGLFRTQTDSFSIVDGTGVIKETLLEPPEKRDPVQIISNIIFNQSTSVQGTCPLSGRSQHELPLEIIQQIFGYLSPLDFNAARHSCRTWMRASLDVNIIKVMLIRGGWSNDTKTTCAATESQAWPYSRYLSRQCALMAGWTGNGFDHTAAIAEASNIDLTELSNGYDVSNGEQYGGLLYSISNCGDFVLIARDTLVEVYGLWAGTLLLVNRLVCPRRVLCMSMDASSGCHAVALLLEGRMGQVCELHHDSDDEGCPAVHAYESEAFNTVHVQSDCHTIRLRGVDDHRRNERNLINSS